MRRWRTGRWSLVITKHFVAELGYRYLFADYSDDGFVGEMAAQGPYAGVGIRF